MAAALPVLALAACGGGGSSPATQSPASTASPTEAPSPVDVKALDYSEPLFVIDDLNGMLPGAYHTADQGDMTGIKVRGQCGRDAPEPGADAGLLLEIQDETPSFSVTTSVHGFADAADATAAFAALKEITLTCTRYVSQGDRFERIPAPGVQPAGDDSFTFYARKPDTGLIAADPFRAERSLRIRRQVGDRPELHHEHRDLRSRHRSGCRKVHRLGGRSALTSDRSARTVNRTSR